MMDKCKSEKLHARAHDCYFAMLSGGSGSSDEGGLDSFVIEQHESLNSRGVERGLNRSRAQRRPWLGA